MPSHEKYFLTDVHFSLFLSIVGKLHLSNNEVSHRVVTLLKNVSSLINPQQKEGVVQICAINLSIPEVWSLLTRQRAALTKCFIFPLCFYKFGKFKVPPKTFWLGKRKRTSKDQKLVPLSVYFPIINKSQFLWWHLDLIVMTTKRAAVLEACWFQKYILILFQQ